MTLRFLIDGDPSNERMALGLIDGSFVDQYGETWDVVADGIDDVDFARRTIIQLRRNGPPGGVLVWARATKFEFKILALR